MPQLSALDQVFPRQFNSIELRPADPINLEDFIDTIEEIDSPSLQLDYDRAASWCSLRLMGVHVRDTPMARLRFTRCCSGRLAWQQTGACAGAGREALRRSPLRGRSCPGRFDRATGRENRPLRCGRS